MPLQRTSPSGFKSWGIGEERPSLMSVSPSTMPTQTSRRSGNGWNPIWFHDGGVCTGNRTSRQLIRAEVAANSAARAQRAAKKK